MEIVIFLSGLIVGATLILFWPKKQENQNKIKEERDKLLAENQNYKQQEKKWIEQSFSVKQLEKELDKQKLYYRERIKEREVFFSEEKANLKQHYEDRILEQKQNHEKITQNRDLDRKQLKILFDNLANKALKDTLSHSAKESEKSLNSILIPLKEKLTTFEKTFQETSGERKEQIGSLKNYIKEIRETNENLTKALKGNTKVQGDWGEGILKRILENSGLREDENFTIQKVLQNEDGRTLRPDVIVHLPKERDIIIDSKVSLTHYHNYTLSKTEEERKQCAKQISSSLSQHVDDLAKKFYQKAKGLHTPNFVLMFIPLEGVLSFALRPDKNLFEEAFKKHIMIVSPITLHATLKIIDSLWQIERQNKNVEKIVRQGGYLYDRFAGFLKHMDKLNEGLKTARDSYDKAFKKLKTGKGNLISTAQKLSIMNTEKAIKKEKSIIDTVKEIKKLGAETKNKKLPVDSNVEEENGEVLQIKS